MYTVRRRFKIPIGAITDHRVAAAWLVGGLLILGLSSTALGQAPAPGTAVASAATQGTAFIQWNLGPVGGGAISQIQIRHCSAGLACTTANPTLFQGGVTLTDCDQHACPSYVYDPQLTASTTYVEMVTVIPASSNTTGQATSALTGAYTTPAFPVPSITSVQGVSGSSVLLTTTENDQYYGGMNVYGCPGTGCTNFTLLDNSFFSDTNLNTAFPPSPSTLTGLVGGLIPSTTYTLYVTAFDGVNTSAASPTFTMQTPAVDTTPPTTPTNLTATVISPTEISLSYGSSTDNLYLSGYQVQRCAGAGCTNFTDLNGSGLALTYDDTGLTPSTTYQYVVRAIDGSDNQSPPSNVVAVATLPGTPTALTASNATSTQVTLAWTPVGNVAGLAAYLIEQCQGAGCSAFSQVARVTSPSGQITGLRPRTTYQFRVRSLDPSGNDSGYSNIVTVNTLPIAGPTAVMATALSDSQITVTWTASTAPGVSAYLIERCARANCTNFVQIASTPNAPYMDGGLSTQSVYQYRIRATDPVGDLSDYVTTSTTTSTLPAPAELSGSAVSTSQINLSWFASPSADIASYLIERCSGAGCTSFAQTAAVSGTSYSDTGLAPNTTYQYRVRATDPAGALSAYTPAVTVKTLALAPATNLTATATSSSQVSLAWSASPTAATSGYIVQRCNGAGCNGFAPIATVTSVSYADAGLSGSTTYSYRVQATDAAGDVSAGSNIARVTTPSGSGSGGTGGGSGGSGGGAGSGSGASTYVYDANGHLLTVTTNGVTTTYTYDTAGHVVSIQSGN